jgi:hypothetical protein
MILAYEYIGATVTAKKMSIVKIEENAWGKLV